MTFSPSLPLQLSGDILRGSGAPLPTVGRAGIWYLDTTNGNLYLSIAAPGAWELQTTVSGSIYPTLTCYGNTAPDPNVGLVGAYYLQLLNVYGQLSLTFIGPKTTDGWPT